MQQSISQHTKIHAFSLENDTVKALRYNKDGSLRKPPFGFNGLGEFVYMRTYSRVKNNGKKEQWWETVQRVVEGTFTLQKTHFMNNAQYLDKWDEQKSQDEAADMAERMFEMKFLPPGRGLWTMNTSITKKKGLFAALNNCAFVSTVNISKDLSKPFRFLMDMLMLGVGVGFDSLGSGQIKIHTPCTPAQKVAIEDSREGWVRSLGQLIESYMIPNSKRIQFDYSKIRPEGEELKTFGGFSSGSRPLLELHEGVRKTLDQNANKTITLTTINNICNMVGRCVVSGNVRRSAEISFGDGSDEFLNLKNYDKNPERVAFGWASNNSVLAKVGQEYHKFTKRIEENGEPGFAWLHNMQHYSRMGRAPDNSDLKVRGGNPCLEQSLEPFEICCLVETFPFRAKDLDDFKKTLQVAFTYAKTVTLCESHWKETNRVLLRNRRIGCSITGVAQFLEKNGIGELQKWCSEGYDTVRSADQTLSKLWKIPESIKCTSVKPSGTVSLLAGATPGMHYPISRYYRRRVRVGKDDPLVKDLIKSGFHVEPAVGQEKTTVVVTFPVDCGDVRSQSDVSMWEQLQLAAFLQEHWADNQVSCTVTFKKSEASQIPFALRYCQYRLKGISFLPEFGTTQKHHLTKSDTELLKTCMEHLTMGQKTGQETPENLNKTALELKKIIEKVNSSDTPYPQMPYEPIDRDTYRRLRSKIKPINFSGSGDTEMVLDNYCDGAACEIRKKPKKRT